MFGAAGDNNAELGGHDVGPFRDARTDAMQGETWSSTGSRTMASAAAADHAARLEDLFDARQVLGKRSTIGSTRLRGALGRAILVILFGMDHCHRGFHIFQRQLELFRIALLRFPAEDRLLEDRDRLFRPCNARH